MHGRRGRWHAGIAGRHPIRRPAERRGTAVTALLTSPGLIDLILIFTAMELLVLWLWRRVSGHGPSALSLTRMLLPGVFLMLALRAALDGHPYPFVPLSLAAALAFHLADLRQRWFD